MGQGHEFCFLLYRLNVCNDPMGCGSGEYCTVFSLPITTVTKSLGLGRWRQGVGVRVVSGVVGQAGLHCNENPHKVLL